MNDFHAGDSRPETEASRPVGRVDFSEQLGKRVLVADGAMGTMLQDHDLAIADFDGHEGCNEILNVTRPDVVRAVHEAYLAVGVDCIETNTFGANWSNLGEYGIADRVTELAEAGARVAREAADAWSKPDKPRFVLGSVGPGTKLPTLGHVPFSTLRETYQRQAEGLIEGGADAILVETVQDILQGKAALIGARRAMNALGRDVPLMISVTVETTGTMLVGTETLAALTALEDLGIAAIGLNCATGPAEMSEHLRVLADNARIQLSVMPNAGLPELTADGARYPLGPEELARSLSGFVSDFGVALVGGCCGTTPEHLAAVVAAVQGTTVPQRNAHPEPSVSSVYQAVTLRQDASFLSIGERTNANGSLAFRQALVADDLDRCVDIARGQQRDGAHVLDLCIDYVGRDGVADMTAVASRLATATALPIVLDSTEPAVIEAGLEALGGRCIVNSVNYEDGDGPESRINRIMPLVKEHGAAVVALTIDEEGQARDADWKVRVASRLIGELTGRWGLRLGDILVDTLTFPIATGQDETRRDGIETIEAIKRIKAEYPEVNTTLGISNVSFGLNPAARQVLNSVFLTECRQAGLDSAIVHASKILPTSRISAEQQQAALDLIYDRRTFRPDGSVDHDPLRVFLDLFADAEAVHLGSDSASLADLPLFERLGQRVIDGERNGLEADLDEALAERSALEIVNEVLLNAMRTVGERFGSGQMQLPFVLQSAEVMKVAVAHLEPHMERADVGGRGRMVLATVKGDVHDIGKNLVDIILTNNGYEVVNLGIKQGINAILAAAEEARADAIGMSGLLVKSTVIMKDNLLEMNRRGVAEQWPVLLGGAALTRPFVEHDLAEVFDGQVRYARDAFDGLHLMDKIMAIKRGEPGAELPAARSRRVRRRSASGDVSGGVGGAAGVAGESGGGLADVRSSVAPAASIPVPPFWGTRVVKGISLADYASFLDERALFRGQWGLKPSRDPETSYEDLIETEGRARLRYWLDRLRTESIMNPAVVYGFFPAWSEDDRLIVADPELFAAKGELHPVAEFSFPRQTRGRHLCLADFVRSIDDLEPGQADVLALQVVTMGSRVSEVTAELFAANSYRDYVELHGLSVQLAEALAEYWHTRVRTELGIGQTDAPNIEGILKQGYQGERYSFGYPACPDLGQQVMLVDLLKPERIGVSLSESHQLHPEQSTSALIFHHPEAIYFRAT
ncbi:MAG: methionine synthase [Candidatus Nanopelagicales bacterium]|nr:methionine synthase [Candidatus Nanopelagicales bacterium]